MSRVLVIVALSLVAAGCGTQTPADCQLQSSANGPYALKFSQAGAGTGCTATTGPDTFGDLWQFDPFENRLIVAFSALNSTLPSPPNPNDPIYGKGHFSEQFPDANDLCSVPDFTRMQVDATHAYAVTNLQFLNTALYLGTEFKADVTYTNGACTRPYTVQAINPAHVCAAKADCDPFAQPFASGVNSLYDQGCNLEQWAQDLAAALGGDPGTGICFFNAAFPSLGGWKP
ncbi:MAG TPA: hypothetical protein VLT82_05790 [Myxococcaceae bacterium]|nr:hypothetical protein [Myxococcaceae bacterium]